MIVKYQTKQLDEVHRAKVMNLAHQRIITLYTSAELLIELAEALQRILARS
jgi:hypothetical protein